MEKIEKNIASYIRRHTLMMAAAIIAGFILLAMGEYYLYRQQMKLNEMTAEGTMQIKETIKSEVDTLTPATPVPTIKKALTE